jgi:hypothetical protein
MDYGRQLRSWVAAFATLSRFAPRGDDNPILDPQPRANGMPCLPGAASFIYRSTARRFPSHSRMPSPSIPDLGIAAFSITYIRSCLKRTSNFSGFSHAAQRFYRRLHQPEVSGLRHLILCPRQSHSMAEWVAHCNLGPPDAGLGPKIPKPSKMPLLWQLEARRRPSQGLQGRGHGLTGNLSHKYRWETIAA